MKKSELERIEVIVKGNEKKDQKKKKRNKTLKIPKRNDTVNTKCKK